MQKLSKTSWSLEYGRYLKIYILLREVTEVTSFGAILLIEYWELNKDPFHDHVETRYPLFNTSGTFFYSITIDLVIKFTMMSDINSITLDCKI